MDYPVTTLSQAVRALDPDQALNVTDEQQAQLFVDRHADAIQEVKLLLNHGGRNVKILFSGHRGTGKSTELSRVEKELPDHRVIRFSVRERLNLIDLKASDIVLMVLIQMLRISELDGINVGQNLQDRIQQLGKEITREVEVSTTAGATVKAGFAEKILNLVSLEGRLSKEAVTRHKVREKVEPRLTEIEGVVRELTDSMQDNGGRLLVVIIEDLDKGTLENQRILFKDHSTVLTEMLPLPVIFTFPIALRNHRQDDLFKAVVLPNFKVNEHDGTRCQRDISHMQDIVTKRVQAQLVDDDALDKLVCHSGGIPRLLLRLMRDAAVQALIRQDFKITLADAERTISNERRDYQRILTQEQLAALREIATSGEVDKGRALHLELLDNLSVLEYQNGDLWYEVNPVVLPLLTPRTP